MVREGHMPLLRTMPLKAYTVWSYIFLMSSIVYIPLHYVGQLVVLTTIVVSSEGHKQCVEVIKYLLKTPMISWADQVRAGEQSSKQNVTFLLPVNQSEDFFSAPLKLIDSPEFHPEIAHARGSSGPISGLWMSSGLSIFYGNPSTIAAGATSLELCSDCSCPLFGAHCHPMALPAV